MQLVTLPSAELSGEIVAELEGAKRLYDQRQSENTRRAYAKARKRFAGWCEARGEASFPTEMDVLARYLSHLEQSGLSLSLAQITIAALAEKNVDGWEISRGVRGILEGWKRSKAGEKKRKAPISPEELSRMVDALQGNDFGAIRNRAILLVGWFGAFRRSEIAAFRVGDVEEFPEGLRVKIVRSKTDQRGEGQWVGIPRGNPPYCPVAAIAAWLKAASGAPENPLFCSLRGGGRPIRGNALTGEDVARIVKKAAKKVGLDPFRVAGHSLRSGFATAAALAKQPLEAIMRQTRHRDANVLLRDYVRPASLFEGNAAAPIASSLGSTVPVPPERSPAAPGASGASWLESVRNLAPLTK